MNKLGFVILSLAIVLGFGSCNKENVPEVIETLVFPVSADAADGSKAVVNPEGNVIFQTCDHLYLAYKGMNNNSWLDYQAGGNAKFVGTLNLPSGFDVTKDAPLYFFGLAGIAGGGEQYAYWTEDMLQENCTSTSLCVSLQNQGKNMDGTWTGKTRNMPYLCFGVSRENFPTKDGKYTVDLRNKCAMVKYNVAAGIPWDSEIFVEGLNNVVEVEFVIPHLVNTKQDISNYTNKGYDEDGFRFVKREGKIQNRQQLYTPGYSLKMTNIIIPYRDEPKNEGDKTYCYSCLLPQKEGLEDLSGYYYDKNKNRVDLTIEIIYPEGESEKKIRENWYYEINIGIK